MKKIFFVLLLGVVACTSPRNITQSGKVTPKGMVSGGMGMVANFSGAAIENIALVPGNVIDNYANQDSLNFDDALKNANKAAVAYALDPSGLAYEFYIKYGLLDRLDIGYKRVGKANVFSTQYQFLGSTGRPGDENGTLWHGSVALQYTNQGFQLPGFISKIQGFLNYNYLRNDFLIPIIFSRSFGSEEEYGSISFGAAYCASFIQYSFLPQNIYNNGELLKGESRKTNYHSFGGFVNLKLGYKYVYIIPSLSIYHQNYGTYPLLNGENFDLRGLTVIPSLGIQFQIGKLNNSSRKEIK